ncbi:MAG: hypothetical protein H7222_04495 [Methylotenera sp.]|nr:hypothetical protein [Oligoflexia bacterium]
MNESQASKTKSGTAEMIEAEKKTQKRSSSLEETSGEGTAESTAESNEKNGNQESEQERSKGVIFHSDKPSSDHSEAA